MFFDNGNGSDNGNMAMEIWQWKYGNGNMAMEMLHDVQLLPASVFITVRVVYIDFAVSLIYEYQSCTRQEVQLHVRTVRE